MSEELHPTRDVVLAAYAAAMLAAQQLEEAMVGLVGITHDLDLWKRGENASDFDRLEQGWESLFDLTAGQLLQKLQVDDDLAADIQQAVTARNLLAHHYMRDHKTRLTSAVHRATYVSSLQSATKKFTDLSGRIETERFTAMHAAGVTDDEVFTPEEVRRMRYYDPTIDDDVPPEPFADA